MGIELKHEENAARAAAHALLRLPPEQRAPALANALYDHGMTLFDSLRELRSQSPEGTALYQEATDLFSGWIQGSRRLTNWPDDEERRLRALADVAALALRQEDPDAAFWEAMGSHHVPRGHPEHDVPRTTSLLGDDLVERVDAGDYAGALSTARLMLGGEPGDADAAEQLLELSLELTDLVAPVYAQAFRSFAVDWWVSRALEARDAGDAERQRAVITRATAVLGQLAAIKEHALPDGRMRRLEALVADAADEADAAQRLEAEIAEAGDSHDAAILAVMAARAHERADRPQDVVRVLRPWLSLLRGEYLKAACREDETDTGEVYATALYAMVDAHIQRGEWGTAAELVDRGKSLRLRFQASLRADARFLDMERSIYAAERRPEWTRAEEGWVSPLAALQTLYAQERERLVAAFDDDVTLDEVARVLAPDEGVLLLACTDAGVLSVVLTRRGGAIPAATLYEPGQPETLLRLFSDDVQQPGWLDVAATPWLVPPERRSSLLAHLIEAAEERLIRQLARRIQSLGLRRLIVVPHRLLHPVPFHVMPSLRPYVVTTVSSAATLVRTREERDGPPLAAGRRAVVVANPTSDLPLAAVEASTVTERLRAQGWEVQVRGEQEATLSGILDALSPSPTILHFSGHGRSDILNASRSALLVHAPATAPALFADWLEAAVNWRYHDDGDRIADLPEAGRLIERHLQGDVIDRILERPNGGAVWTRSGPVRSGPAELWTAADLLLDDHLTECALAVLAGCETGGIGLEHAIDEYTGLPAALQLAGVRTVVATGWRVSDRVAALWADLFYEELCCTDAPMSIANAVHQAADRLRTLTPTAAAARAAALAGRAVEPRSRFRLQAWAHALGSASHPPFADPWLWGAFAAFGDGQRSLARSSPGATHDL
ncbi:CHAT domain-containing protein [Streptomyces sp. NPDC056486]|uniref:CHAT domain-containing protein n=1 Tax=Streptomyces sp. NPDC056486 TaxID=3345835 RepID=UPI0036C6CFAD